MIVQLTPDDEKLVHERMRSGAFESVEDVIHQALRVQEAEEAWLVLHKREIEDKLVRAIQEFDGGGGIPASKVRQRLQEMRETCSSCGE